MLKTIYSLARLGGHLWLSDMSHNFKLLKHVGLNLAGEVQDSGSTQVEFQQVKVLKKTTF